LKGTTSVMQRLLRCPSVAPLQLRRFLF